MRAELNNEQHAYVPPPEPAERSRGRLGESGRRVHLRLAARPISRGGHLAEMQSLCGRLMSDEVSVLYAIVYHHKM